MRQVLPACDRKGAFQTPFPIPANSTRSVAAKFTPTFGKFPVAYSGKTKVWNSGRGERREEQEGGENFFPRKDVRSPFLFLRDNTDKLERTKVVSTTFLPSYNLLQRLGPPIEVRGGEAEGFNKQLKK